MYDATRTKETDEPQYPLCDYEFLDSTDQVESLVRVLGGASLVAVDVEADSLYHFKERVCLVQISSLGRNYIVDPLSRADLSLLSPIFSDPSIKKVFHGADYDIRSLFRDYGIKVKHLFDTQIAARFLGVRETGLASILACRFKVHLSKKHQKSNWTKRPLTEEMLSYAVSDTAHLPELYAELSFELGRLGRLSWVEEECDILSGARPSGHDGPLFLRFKGAGRMDGRSLAVLENVLEFRKEEAKRRDVPPFKVIPDRAVEAIALHKPEDPDRLAKVAGLAGKQIPLAQSLARCVAVALALPEDGLPDYPKTPRTRTDAKTAARTVLLKEFRDTTAGRLGLDPSLVLTNAQIRDIAARPRRSQSDLENVPTLRRWQRETFGDDLVSAMGPADRRVREPDKPAT